MRWRSALLGVLCLLASELLAGDAPVHFVYAGPHGARICLTTYESGHFVPPNEELESEAIDDEPENQPVDIDKRDDRLRLWDLAVHRALQPFPVGKSLTGVDAFGKPVRAKVTLNDPNDRGELVHLLEVDQGGPALLTDPPLALEAVAQEVVYHLEPELDQLFRARAEELWKKHGGEAKAATHSVDEPETTRVEGKVLSVIYPVEFERHYGDRVESDDLGSFFFLYSLEEKRIVRGAFGHTAWGSYSDVLTIKPAMFFRVAGEPALYFVGTRLGGYEPDDEYAIYDTRDGKERAYCY